MNSFCIKTECPVPNIFILNFLSSDEILIKLFLPFVEAFNILTISHILCSADHSVWK